MPLIRGLLEETITLAASGGECSYTATTLNPSMNTPRGAGKYQTPYPIQSIDDANVPVVLAPRLWTELKLDDI